MAGRGRNSLWQAGSNGDLNLYFGPTDLYGKTATKLTNGQYRVATALDNSNKAYWTAKFSPDGKTIAVAGSKIFFLSVPGQQSPYAGRVISDFNNPYWLTFSPDGQTLLVASSGSSGGLSSLYNLTTNHITNLKPDIDLGQADWSGKAES